MPTEPNEIEPGLALASAMKSWMVFQGRAFGTIITLALDPIISTEKFRFAAGIEATHVPYRAGPEVIADILGGRIDLYFCPLATALPLIREGQVRALVVSTPKRVADLPDVPTPVEIGLKDADSVIWFGVFAPAKTPRDIVEKLHVAGEKVLADPAMQASLKKLGIEPMPMKPADMDDLVKRETAANLELIKAAGIKP